MISYEQLVTGTSIGHCASKIVLLSSEVCLPGTLLARGEKLWVGVHR